MGTNRKKPPAKDFPNHKERRELEEFFLAETAKQTGVCVCHLVYYPAACWPGWAMAAAVLTSFFYTPPPVPVPNEQVPA